MIRSSLYDAVYSENQMGMDTNSTGSVPLSEHTWSFTTVVALVIYFFSSFA